MVSQIMNIPFNQGKFQTKALEMIGDIFIRLKNYNEAVVYYMLGVM